MTIEEIAKLMVIKGKGILAADESTGTMGKRLKSVNIESNEKNRLHFSVKNPDQALPRIIKKLSEANIHINSIDSTQSSLEDVFLDLTGKGINE